jgi:TDG/mug DNA glycosylase family protein
MPLPDVLEPGLRIVFCGINPGLYSAAVGHHFARPGNRFWPALYSSGFTKQLLTPDLDSTLPSVGVGLTNLVDRATAVAAELSSAELTAGVVELERKINKHKPVWLAVLGIGAFRTAFGQPNAKLGRQDTTVGGASLWVLPNPSGLNGHYQPRALAAAFTELRLAAFGSGARGFTT